MSYVATDRVVGSVTNTQAQPDLLGNLFPVSDELDVPECRVTGKVPEGLRGHFVRNGPNPAFEPIGTYHMFDGDGMLHGITFDDGRVSYRNRWIRSRGLALELERGSAVYPGLGDVMNFPPREVTGDAGPVKNPANTHVISHADRWLALWEGGLPTEVTPELETIGEHDFGGRLKGSMTAHPRLDPVTGEMLMFGYSLFEPYLRYHVVDAGGELVHSVDIDLPAPVMMHDFITTERHAVFLDSPIVFDLENLGKGPMVRWKPENGTRIGVMPRMGTAEDLRWFEIDPGHVQHFWSGWADGERIEFHGSRFDAPDFAIEADADPNARNENRETGRPARFWVDLDAGTAGWEPMDDLAGDFNRINDGLNGQKVRYLYMSALTEPGRQLGDFDSIVKYDDDTGARMIWGSGPNGHIGETVFAPNPDGDGEDDGWLLNTVHHDDTDTTDVVVLEARDISAGPVATVHMPRRVPFGFHANWFPTT